MNKTVNVAVGIICLVIGGLLIYWGYTQAQSLAGEVTNAVTGSPSDNTKWMYVGGAILAVIGVFMTAAGIARK